MEDRPADEHRSCAERQRLQHVRAAPDATVDQQRQIRADRVDDARQRVDGRRDRVEVAAAVVRDEDAGDPLLAREHGVVRIEHALQQHRQLRQRLEPLDVLPGELLRQDVGERAVLGVHLLARRRGEPAQIRHLDAGRQVELHALLAIARAVDRRVDGDDERAIAGSLGALDELGGVALVLLDVELEPLRRLRRGSHVLERRARERAQRHQRRARVRTTGRRDLAVGMRELEPEHADARVDRADVAQHARVQADALVRLAVPADRQLVRRAAVDVLPRHVLHPPRGDRLEVGEVDHARERGIGGESVDRLRERRAREERAASQRAGRGEQGSAVGAHGGGGRTRGSVGRGRILAIERAR